MSDSKMLEEFEADLEYRNIPGVGQFYECPRTLLALEAWRASRAALVVELPKADFFSHPEAAAWAISECREALKAAGLELKP